VLAPSTVQEAADLTIEAFDLADKYRNPVMVLGDGIIGQMMEPVEFKKNIDPSELPAKPWATTGCQGRKPNIINSLFLKPEELEEHNWHLYRKYQEMAKEARHETYQADGEMDVLIVAYGTVARIARTSIDALTGRGLKVGLFRPVTLYPYPTAALVQAAGRAKHVLVAELSTGQMVEDVRAALAASGKRVGFYGRVGGMVMGAEELAEQVEKLAAAATV
jgi:2-oxoglutarate ferredoxin oxidoreductase subunit alpha